jgi:hypothetical protein
LYTPEEKAQSVLKSNIIYLPSRTYNIGGFFSFYVNQETKCLDSDKI